MKFFRTAKMLLFGILAALPLVLNNLPLLSFVLWIPFCYTLKRILDEEKTSLGGIYASALSFFFGYFATSLSFFPTMYPLDFAGLSTLESIAVVLAAMLLVPLFQSAVFSITFLLLAFFKRRRLFSYPCAYSLFFASLCLISFYLQNFTWLGVPWASIAVGLTAMPVLTQSASLLGSTFLTFLVLLVNALLSEALDAFRTCKDKHALIAVSLAAVLFFGNIFSGIILLNRQKTPSAEIKIAVLQGCSPIKNELSYADLQETYEELAMKAASEGATVMLWPESIIRHALEGDYGLKLYFFDLAEKTNATQVVGAFSSKDGFYNSLFLIYPNRTISEEIYHKRRPVPFGEYIPYPELFDALLPTLTEISALSFDIIPGDSTSLFHTKDGLLGGLICFDSIYPALARQSTLDGAELLLLSTNDTWFDGSFAKNMHLSHAQLRAVENGRTVIRCGNTGISAAIDAHGRIYAETPPDEAAYFTVSASLYKSPTLYTRLGDVIVYCAIAFLIISPFAAIKPKNKKA